MPIFFANRLPPPVVARKICNTETGKLERLPGGAPQRPVVIDQNNGGGFIHHAFLNWKQLIQKKMTVE